MERLLTRPLLRCTQTLEPLAAALALELEPVEQLSVEADAAWMAAMLEDAGTEHAVLCTQGEVLQTLFAQLRDGAKLRDSVEPPFQKGSAWALERSGDRFRSRYLGPRPTRRSDAGADG